MELNLCLMGFGSVGRELVKLIDRKAAEINAQYGLTFKVVGIATGAHGLLLDPTGIDTSFALADHWGDRAWPATDETRRQLIHGCAALGTGALVEMSPINRQTGRPALDYLELALSLGLHAVTANKGPVVHGYRHLRDLAKKQNRAFLFEATVMDGFPLLNLYRECLPATQVTGFRGVLNSTSNLVLSLMAEGQTFDAAVKYAQSIGIAETDPSNDVDGWDSAVKVCVLANVLMGADLRPEDVDRTGIRGITPEMMTAAAQADRKWRLICSADRTGDTITARVAPQQVAPDDPAYRLPGTTSVVQLRTDTLNQLTLLETAPTPAQTAFGVLADLISAARGHF